VGVGSFEDVMKKRIGYAGLLKALFVLAIVLPLASAAQTPVPKPTPPEDEVIKVNSRLVVVPVSVTDANGNPVTGLTTADFRVLEENRQQTLESVSGAEKVPLEIVLLFDVSASTDTMFKSELETAGKFLRDVMRPEDRAAIFTVGERPIMIQPRDTAEKSIASIQSIVPMKGFTAFYDTVAAASDYLRKNAPEHSRRVILVISDGEDTNSERVAKAIQDGYRKIGDRINTIDSKSLYQLTVASRDQAAVNERMRVLQLLQNGDTVFYSINPAGSSYQLNKMSVFGQQNMQKFAEDTGGAAFLPRFLPVEGKNPYDNASNIRRNGEMLDLIFKQLASELRSQYLIQYYSETEYAPNKYVRLDVAVPGRGNPRVRARQGYYVKN
jgi:Ca-activated chloride channel family protein